MSFSVDLERTARACALAQDIYQRDLDASGRVGLAWHALPYWRKDDYIDRAVIELELRNVIPFPATPKPVHPSELVPHAVRAIENAITDLVNAANAARSESEAVDVQDVIKELTIKLNAASLCAYHRETQFYPKGA